MSAGIPKICLIMTDFGQVRVRDDIASAEIISRDPLIGEYASFASRVVEPLWIAGSDLSEVELIGFGAWKLARALGREPSKAWVHPRYEEVLQ